MLVREPLRNPGPLKTYPRRSAMGGEADVPPGMQQLELAFVVFARFERTREGLKLVGVRNRPRAMTGRLVE